MDRGVWWDPVHGVAQSQRRMRASTHTHTHKKFKFTLKGEIAKLFLNHMEKPRSNNCQENLGRKIGWVN